MVTVKPAAQKPSSTLTLWRTLTSPEPVPPRTVWRTPAPYSAIFPGLGSGKAPLRRKNSVHPASSGRSAARCRFS